ncbi:hypothetical protein L0B53_01045 [Vibrio sp. SS-MA-C1-2]|uniref:hypothetical protein n=1 Tax=Vibrio sp. SS-MA-C1-2 TaxID=2908646 RepID=UPI001F231E9B|nr:hypothetical protein [Vibrio sp. SS-MA-C1-2]UJF17394.1 hypothetical protein L0B53_01045 [Vibrio sp. SS-MA-C1-2]
MNRFGFIKLFMLKNGEQTLLTETALSPNRELIIHWVKHQEYPQPSEYLLMLSDNNHATLLTKFISKEAATLFTVSVNQANS